MAGGQVEIFTKKAIFAAERRISREAAKIAKLKGKGDFCFEEPWGKAAPPYPTLSLDGEGMQARVKLFEKVS